MKYKHFLYLFILSLFSSCFDKDPPAANVSYSCPTSEDFSGNSSTLSVGATEKISEGFGLNGIVGAKLHLTEIIINMDTSNLSSIKLSLYKDLVESHVHTPDDGTLLGTVTVTSGLGSSDSSTEISFYFSSSVSLDVGGKYFFVLEPTGGSFNISQITPQKVTSATIWKHNGSSWSQISSTGSNLSFSMNYSHCTNAS